MEVYWLLDHFAGVTIAEMASILSVSNDTVRKLSALRSKQRNKYRR